MINFIGGNQIKLLRSGVEYFPALEATIESASHDIYLQSYIYQADAVGFRIGNALIRAAQRGVHVHILLDGFGCKDLPKSYIKTLELAGIQIIFYRPKISPWSLKKNRLRRLHRKVIVIDNKIGFVGGINIIDDFDVPNRKPNNVPPRIDYAVRIEGRLLPAIAESVHKLWWRMAWIHLLSIKNHSNKFSNETPPQDNTSGVNAAFVIRDNVLHRNDIENAYLEAINAAKYEIIIANAYFVPGRRFRKALLDAAKRGVTVKLLLQGRMEYFLMFATHAFYGEFLRNGIEIYEYRKSFMHSKVAVIDKDWSTVGSSNIDPFSLLLAREANVIVKDVSFSTELREDIIFSIQDGATQVSPKEWAKGNVIKSTASWIAFGLVRVFLGVIGQSNEH
ncbi:MAG: cardiolipin synthase ClsB [Methylotenera sp.]|nr:cardiolipin synthase ClsB [Methylotenera sp.]